MATHIPLHPFNLGDNDAYLFLVEGFIHDRLDTWQLPELEYEFGKISLDELFKENVITLKRDSDFGQLTFRVSGSLPQFILELVTDEPKSFPELLKEVNKIQVCSSNQLKNYLSYLYNFNLIQDFVPPAQAITFIAIEGDDSMEKELDMIYRFADRLETKCIYQMNNEENLAEFLTLR